MSDALIFSLPAAHRFHAGIELPDDWSSSLNFGGQGQTVFTVRHGRGVYIFGSGESTIAPSIVIRLEPGKLFSCFDSKDTQLEALRRTVQAGIAILDGGGKLPDYWRPFSGGKYVTFQATSIAKGDPRRLALWRRITDGTDKCTYVFDITRTQRDYDNLDPDFAFLAELLSGRQAALKSFVPTDGNIVVGTTTVALDHLPQSKQVDAVVHGWKLSYLYQSRLTSRQREFVDTELDRPIRLKGAAGTGKTLVMIAKLLKEAQRRRASGTPYRFLFVTHNTSAAELALDYAMGLDEESLISSSRDDQLIHIDTLLGLAIHDLAEDLGELQPISNDAHEGKKLQLFILSDVVTAYARSSWITQRRTASQYIRDAIDAPPASSLHEEFCWDLMNEIACVLDADGVRDNVAKRDSYTKERRRPRYLMPLENVVDKQIVLMLYDLYRATLRREEFISVDQLMADYIGYLDSFRWDARRQRLGYDAIFVDEYHLFNRLERASFGSLVRNVDSTWPIILMALDPRQSPRAVFLEAVFGNEEAAIPLAAGQAKELRDFEFNDVFRYTPEIAKFLAFVNQSFPESDLSEEWLPGLAESALQSGERPVAREFSNQNSMYDSAIAEGERMLRRVGRGSVALLTLSNKSFDLVAKSGYRDRLYIIDSRESLNRLQYVGGRIVFSMPEYVAGVQFEHVIVTDVNENDDVGRPTSMGRSRFGSNLYLGASRARRSVALFGNRIAGGLAGVIKRAVHDGIVTAA